MERLIRMGVALGVGLTVGLERGWRAREAAEGSRIAGWRTFGLIGLAAGIWADIGGSNLVALGMALLAITVSLAVAYWRKSETSADRSATTLVAAIVTFALGGLAGQGHTIEAGAGAVVMTAMLSAKSTLHGWLKRLSEIELRAALQFLLISVVILPILPNRGFGPYDALNPYQIWLMVVFVAGLSFAGYAAMRIWGQQAGLMLTALLGGIVASTAIAFDFSRRAAAGSSPLRLLAAGIVAASGVSFVRTAILVGVFQRAWLPVAGIPIAAMVAASGCAVWLLSRGGPHEQPLQSQAVRNPLELRSALQLGLVLAVALVLSEWLRRHAGSAGLAGLSAITGVVEIDATTISLSKMVGEGLSKPTATLMLLLGLTTNALLKMVVITAVGGARLALAVGLSFVLVAAAAAAAFLVIM
jgi:uncharacterized membrane protein (DUF4010 family)